MKLLFEERRLLDYVIVMLIIYLVPNTCIYTLKKYEHRFTEVVKHLKGVGLVDEDSKKTFHLTDKGKEKLLQLLKLFQNNEHCDEIKKAIEKIKQLDGIKIEINKDTDRRDIELVKLITSLM